MTTAAEQAQLTGRIILITGAANGIGASVSQALAKAGATTILLDKQLPQLEKLYDVIVGHNLPEPALYPLDLKGATLPDYQDLAQTISSEFGRLDGMIHCAATLGQLAPVEHQDPKTWLDTLHVNLTGAYLLTQACLSLLKQTPKSQLIFTTDEHKHTAYWGAYGIAKAGIEALSAQLADELESQGNVNVHCLDPGSTQTNLFARAYPAIDPSALPLPDDIAPQYLACFKS
jgi:NAD(P)-dependent dehydrogenase (short-subunit alcohol dehydrogenase family)